MDLKQIEKMSTAYLRALRDRTRASEARRLLPPGSTRARITSANARWMSACEKADRMWEEMKKAGLEDLGRALDAVANLEREACHA